jgi:nitrous oxide reductase accessory protein NosL
MNTAALALAVLLLAGADPVKPEPREKCPVCGMFVARYPDWVAGIRFQDGSRALFDGAKDLFKLLLRVEDYGAVSRRTDVASIFVTDYYALTQVDARTAWFVVGSDVLGPMGHELVPFAREAEAREFLRDHRGKQVLRFAEVTPALLKALDAGGP